MKEREKKTCYNWFIINNYVAIPSQHENGIEGNHAILI